MQHRKNNIVLALGLLAFLAVLFVPGAASADFLDPDMIMAFTKKGVFNNTPIELRNYDSSSISLKQRLANTGNMRGAVDYMSTYAYDGENDAVAKIYVETAKARGNVVRSYKPQINQIISQNFRKPVIHLQKNREYYDRDRTLIEFDKSGKIISFMARAEEAMGSIAGSVIQYITIFLGPQNARHLENKLTKKDLEQYFVREL